MRGGKGWRGGEVQTEQNEQGTCRTEHGGLEEVKEGQMAQHTGIPGSVGLGESGGPCPENSEKPFTSLFA